MGVITAIDAAPKSPSERPTAIVSTKLYIDVARAVNIDEARNLRYNFFTLSFTKSIFSPEIKKYRIRKHNSYLSYAVSPHTLRLPLTHILL